MCVVGLQTTFGDETADIAMERRITLLSPYVRVTELILLQQNCKTLRKNSLSGLDDLHVTSHHLCMNDSKGMVDKHGSAVQENVITRY